MIVALTVFMCLTLLVLVPLRARVNVFADVKNKTLFVYVNALFVWVFKDKLVLYGRNLQCSGTVNAQVDVFDVDKEAGKTILKALVFDSVDVTFALDYTQMHPFSMFFVESVLHAATAVACAACNCNVHVSTQFSVGGAVLAEVRISVSIAEILYALAKNSVRRKRRKHGRSTNK